MKRGVWIVGLEEIILDFLWDNGSSTRDEICENIKKPRTTVFERLVLLERNKEVEKFRLELNGKPGRPTIYWRLVSND